MKTFLLILAFAVPAFAGGQYGFEDSKLNKEFEENSYEHKFPNWVNARGSSLTVTQINVSTLAVSGSARVENVLTVSTNVLVGITTPRDSIGAGNAIRVQVEGTDFPTSSLSLYRNSNNTGTPALLFGKSRGSTTGSQTIVQDNDILGSIYFTGADGVTSDTVAARIRALVDGTPGVGDVPGELEFQTQPAGGALTTWMTLSPLGTLTVPSITVTTEARIRSSSATAIEALVPTAVGVLIYCNNCAALRVCVSTGTARGAWSSPVAATTACR